ncbi:hypothetical protein JCM10207_007461 [Rhodosporidiobolus poonsookiae]
MSLVALNGPNEDPPSALHCLTPPPYDPRSAPGTQDYALASPYSGGQALHRTPGHARHSSTFPPPHLSLFTSPRYSQQNHPHSLSTPPRTPSPTATRSAHLVASPTLSPLLNGTFASPVHPARLNGTSNGYGDAPPAWQRDPILELERRGTPFFMALPDADDDSPDEGDGPAPAPTLRSFASLAEAETAYNLANGESGRTWAPPAVGASGMVRATSESVCEDDEMRSRRDSGYSEVRALSSPASTARTLTRLCARLAKANLTNHVHALTSRVSALSNLADNLYVRLSFLEEATYARDRELDALRALVAAPPQPPQPRSAYAFPSPAAGWPDSGGDLTPPASAPLLRHPHPHHPPFPYPPVPGSAGGGGSRASTPRSYSSSPTHGRSRAHSVAVPPYGPVPPPQHPYQHHPSFALPPAPGPYSPYFPAPPAASLDARRASAAAMGSGGGRTLAEHALQQALAQPPPGCPGSNGLGFGGEGQRARSMSLAGGSASGSSSSQGARASTLHVRTGSLGSASMGGPRSASGPGRNGIVEQLNYRLLLENDAEIDNEAFVRRILVHNDQQCSLFLQQRVRTTTPEKRQQLFEAVGKNVLDLSFSKFGNFLVSRCLESGDLKLAQSYEKALLSHFLQLALDPFGCHVVQKLLDCGDSATKSRIIEELMPHPSTLMQKNSGHVWNRILTTSNPPAFYRRLAEMGQGTWADVVQDDGGSLIVQHLLEDWQEAHTSGVAREVLERAAEIAKTACGSFVLGHLIDRNALPFCAKVMQSASTLALDNFGAKMVDRAVRTGRVPSATIAGFVEQLTQSSESDAPLLVKVAAHVNGAQLIASLLAGPATSYRDKNKLVRCIALHEQALTGGGNAHGAKLVGMCVRVKP